MFSNEILILRITWATIIVWVFLIMSTLVLSAKEVFQLMHSQKLYFLNWENWVQWGIIINVVMVSFHRNPLENINKFTFLVTRWQHHAAAVGVFLVWGELMLMVGRLPTFGKFSFKCSKKFKFKHLLLYLFISIDLKMKASIRHLCPNVYYSG